MSPGHAIMSRLHIHTERHLIKRIGWLRAVVLGANDGILSTASLIVGVASASAAPKEILIAGIAGIVAGAMSMAAGEYVSVSSQADTERADLARESAELKNDPAAELDELAAIYTARGVDEALARQVAIQMTHNDPLGTHAREELGLTDLTAARPITAAFASAGSFAVGAILPVITAIFCPPHLMIQAVSGASMAFLALLGIVGARAGGANIAKAVARVMFWGAFAMAITASIGAIFGARVG